MEPELTRLGEEKLTRMRRILDLTKQELLLVNLEELTPLLEKKDALIEEIRALDESLAGRIDPDTPPPWQPELNRLAEAILANERTMEERLLEAQSDLLNDLQTLERQSRVKRYLEAGRATGRSVNLKR